MPEKKTLERAHAAKRQGKSGSTQAGAFVKEQVDHIREGKHGAKSTKQAIAIGLSEARRAGVKLKPPKKGSVSEATRRKAKSDSDAGQGKTPTAGNAESHAKRSAAATKALKRESGAAASPKALSKQAHESASRRSAAERSAAAKKGAATRAAAARSQAAKKKAAATRASRAHH
ncbi:DUF6496 domain-containing protein [Pararobbsia alpina]|uniref:DNA-binding protein n=1 Tax=Pararobbsia alpina TaxID=621374 RepID=A0A6S7B9K0_9BURK|nr:DUF6496 domain-containing protein [Pararobbsia alpina]CAB3792405.1 hypothetical protein LMG28138_03341 [Pararobbsia alpina]